MVYSNFFDACLSYTTLEKTWRCCRRDLKFSEVALFRSYTISPNNDKKIWQESYMLPTITGSRLKNTHIGVVGVLPVNLICTKLVWHNSSSSSKGFTIPCVSTMASQRNFLSWKQTRQNTIVSWYTSNQTCGNVLSLMGPMSVSEHSTVLQPLP